MKPIGLSPFFDTSWLSNLCNEENRNLNSPDHFSTAHKCKAVYKIFDEECFDLSRKKVIAMTICATDT